MEMGGGVEKDVNREKFPASTPSFLLPYDNVMNDARKLKPVVNNSERREESHILVELQGV